MDDEKCAACGRFYKNVRRFGKWIRDRKRRAAVSLLAGVLSVFLVSAGTDSFYRNCAPGVSAWWGVMYPEFCSARILQEDAASAPGRKPEVKYSFWILRALGEIFAVFEKSSL